MVVALARLPPQRAAIVEQPRCIGRLAEQARGAVRQPGVHFPAAAQLVFDGQLVALRAHRGIAVARLAQEARIGQRAQLLVDRHDAPVERRLELRRLEGVGHNGIVGRQPRERWRDHITPAGGEVPEAVVGLRRHAQPVGEALGQRSGQLGRQPVLVVAARRQRDLARGLELRRARDDVDDTARIAAPVERCRRPLQHVDARDVDGVHRHVVGAVGREAVDEVVRARVQVAGKAADGEVVGDAAQVVLSADAADPVERRVQPRGAEVVQRRARDHADGLGHVLERRVSQRGGGRAPGPQTFSRLRADDRLLQRQRRDLVCGGQLGRAEQCHPDQAPSKVRTDRIPPTLHSIHRVTESAHLSKFATLLQ